MGSRPGGPCSSHPRGSPQPRRSLRLLLQLVRPAIQVPEPTSTRSVPACRTCLPFANSSRHARCASMSSSMPSIQAPLGSCRESANASCGEGASTSITCGRLTPAQTPARQTTEQQGRRRMEPNWPQDAQRSSPSAFQISSRYAAPVVSQLKRVRALSQHLARSMRAASRVRCTPS